MTTARDKVPVPPKPRVQSAARAVAILLAELRLRRAALSGLVGGAFGAVVGLFAALLVTFVISHTSEPEPTKSFLEYTALFAFAYLGFVVGAEKGGGVHLEKIGDRQQGDGDGDFFGDIRRKIAEGEFDPMTANLMTWYIAEEIDSGRRLREAYDCVREKAGMKKAKAAPAMGAPSADAEAIMACMTAGFARLEKTLEKLAKAK